MKSVLLILAIVIAAFPCAYGQTGITLTTTCAAGASPPCGATLIGGVSIGGIGVGTVGTPQLPLLWADNHECDGSYDVTKEINVDYTNNAAGVNQAILDWFNAADQRWHVVGAAGLVTDFSTSVLTMLGKASATKCLVFETKSSTLTLNQTVCSHKTIDNSDGSSPRNLGCTNDIASMWTWQFAGSGGNNIVACTIGAANCLVGPNHYEFKGMEIKFASSYTTSAFLVNTDDGDTTGLLGSSHIWFVEDFIHGDATDSGTGNNAVASLVKFNSCSYCGLAYNYFDECLRANNESHIWSAEWAPGPLKIVHNWFEGCAIAFITGGSTVSPFLPYENVFDVEQRGNRFTNPPGWMSNPGGALDLKSRGENKTASRWLEDGNIYEYSPAIGQSGQCRTFTVRNVSSGTGDNYGNSVNDITMSNFICRHMITGIQMDARSGSVGNGGGVAQPIKNISVSYGLFYDIDPAGSIDGSVSHPYIIETGSQSNSWTCTALRDVTGTKATLTCADGGTGFHRTTTNIGDAVHVASCSDSSFNTSTRAGGFPNQGPAAIAGTLPGGLVVVYSNTGTANATATGCVFSNEQSYPKYFSAQKLTIIGAPSKTFGGIPACNNIDRYAQGFTFRDNLIAGKPSTFAGLVCQGDSNTEGKVSEIDMFDTATATFNHNTYPGRAAANYTDWPGAINPSSLNWFPANVTCAGATWDVTCIGLKGMMSGTDAANYEPNATLIVDYDLVPSSAYSSGGSRQASDGKQVGWSRTQFLNAIQSTQYTCATYCGTGPKPD